MTPGKYQPHTTWSETLEVSEEAFCNCHIYIGERLSQQRNAQPRLIRILSVLKFPLKSDSIF